MSKPRFLAQPLGKSPLGAFGLDLWVEDLDFEAKPTPMDDAAYSQALSSMVLVCNDTLIIDAKSKEPFVARRRAKPMQDQWWYIGGRRRFGEVPLRSMARSFKRETSLDLPERRFLFLATYEYIFKDRQQKPQSGGTHTLSHTFAVELDPNEIEVASGALDPKEYYAEQGLRPLDSIDPRHHEVHPFIFDAWERYMSARKRGLL